MGDMPPGDSPPGDLLPYELIVMLVAMEKLPLEKVDPLLLVDTVELMEPGILLRRGVGDPLDEAMSRRRNKSLWLDMPCRVGSSPGGDEALRFWPAAW